MDTVPGNRIIGATHRYQRHQSETTPLYPIVEQHLPALRNELQRHEVQLPRFVLTASTTTYAADDSNMGTCGASLRHTSLPVTHPPPLWSTQSPHLSSCRNIYTLLWGKRPASDDLHLYFCSMRTLLLAVLT